MKFFTGSLAAGLVLLAGSAQAQVPGHYRAVSDVEAPYAVAPRTVPPPPYEPGPRYGYGPSLLPSTEVYSVLRDNGFSPLGIPRLRGFVYTIAAIDRGGADGRLVIDARNGRILRFMPAYRMGGDNYYEEQSMLRGPTRWIRRLNHRRLRPRRPNHLRLMVDQAAVRPSRPAQVASRAVPMPKASPLAAKPASRAASGPAGGRACAEIGRGTGSRPGDNGCGGGQARPVDRADRGNAQGAGAGVKSTVVPAFLAGTSKNAPVFPGRFLLRQMARYSRAPAAASIRSATLSGCETSDKWPASSSMVVAFIRLARNRSRSGLMV